MTRTFAELLAALDADAFDVYQPDVVLAAGMLRGRTIAELALARNRWFTPHTWTNGIGLLANLARRGRGRRRAVPRVPVRPARLDPRAARLHARRADPARRRRRPARPGDARSRDRSSTSRAIEAVRGMTAAAPKPTVDDWLARAAAIAAPDRAVHRRPVRAGGVGPDVRRHRRPRRHRRIAEVAEGGAEDVDRAVAAARRPSTTGAGATSRRPTRKKVLLRLAELVRENLDELALLESLDVGKPIRDTLSGRRPERRDDPPVVRGDDRQGVRRGRADRARRAVARHPRADRRRRRDRALELPADHHGLEARARRSRPATRSCSSRPASRR